MKYKYVAQVDSKDCGIAALSMVMKYYGTNVPLVEIRNLAKTDINGTSALGIIKAAEQFNFETNVIKAKENFLEENEFTEPFIVHVLKNNQMLHYYVVYKITSKYILIADPDSDVGITKIKRGKFYKEWTGIVIFACPNEDYEPVDLRESSLKKIVPIILKQANYIGVIIGTSLIVLCINIISTLFLQRIIDVYIPNQSIDTISIVSIGLIFIYIFQQIFKFIQSLSMINLGKYLTTTVLTSFVGHVFKLPINFFSSRRTGEIVSRFNDANTIVDAISSTVFTIFLDITMIAIVSIVLLVQNFKLFVLVIAAVPIYIIIVAFFFKPLKKINTDTMQSNAVMSSSIIEDLNGISTIKSLKVEDMRLGKLNNEIKDYLNKSFKNNQISVLQDTLKTGVSLILNASILWRASSLIINGQATLGQVVMFTLLISYFLTPLENIINLQPKLQSAQVAFNRLNEVLLVEKEDFSSNHEEKLNLIGDIRISNVSYSYGLNKMVLKDISITFKSNCISCIVGRSGSGKSTLAKLLVRFYEKSSGEIIINEKYIEDISLLHLRTCINYLPQEPYIFSGTVRDNLLLGVENVNEEKLIEVLNMLDLMDEINAMPLGLQTSLSSENITISGGQKQRIALARSLLTDSPVLILDEATSNIDVLLEKEIIKSLSELPDKTIIFIAHRLDIVKNSDYVIVLKDGKIEEQGEYKELINKKGYFNFLMNLDIS